MGTAERLATRAVALGVCALMKSISRAELHGIAADSYHRYMAMITSASTAPAAEAVELTLSAAHEARSSASVVEGRRRTEGCAMSRNLMTATVRGI
jgi:hypothetical protein